MRRGVANYFEREQCAPEWEECELFTLPVRYVPMALSALETRKARSFWTSQDDWFRGLEGINRMQRGLLMPCGEDIIREIREGRGPLIPGTGSTLEEFPVGDYPGFTLGDVARRIGPAGTDLSQQLGQANVLLQQVRDAILAQENNGEDLLAVLNTIAGLLAA